MDDVGRFFMIGFCSFAGCIILYLSIVCFKTGCYNLKKIKKQIKKQKNNKIKPILDEESKDEGIDDEEEIEDEEENEIRKTEIVDK